MKNSTFCCRVCGNNAKPFMTFGEMPIANGFLEKQQFEHEYFFELAPVFCQSCGIFQILEQPDPAMMFNDEYPFFSRSSKRMAVHFSEFADFVEPLIARPAPDGFVVEIGSNDGLMLECFSRKGYRHLGIEPSANVANEAIRHGVNTRVSFFSSALAQDIRDQAGVADAIIAANVVCHIPSILDFATGVALLLAEDGIFAFEEPYLGDMVAKGSFDQIYDEHVFIFSVRSVEGIFARAGLELIDVVAQESHGGSMRYLLAKKGRRPVSDSVCRQREEETRLGLDRPETYDDFRLICETTRRDFRKLLGQLHANGKRVVGYAATSKSTTVLNYCGVLPEWIAGIHDSTPIKQGKYTPGIHIPVVPESDFGNPYPDYAVLFAWNHSAEIRAKQAEFEQRGGRWIFFVPNVNVL